MTARTQRVCVGYLHPGHYAACFAESLLAMMVHDLSGPQRTAHAHGKLASLTGAGGIPAGRNKLAKVTLDDAAADWLLMIDSDMGFDHNTIDRLIAAADPVKAPIVGALCFARKRDGAASFGGLRFRATPTLYTFIDDGESFGFLPMFDYPPDTLVPVAATGAACVLIHRNALAAIRDRHGDAWFDPITHPNGTTFSEDLSFCLRAAACDLPLHVHTGIKTTHDKGSLFLDEDYFVAQEIAAGRRAA